MSIKTTRYLILGVGLLLFTAGIFRGDVLFLWRRATQLCLSCIGIG